MKKAKSAISRSYDEPIRSAKLPTGVNKMGSSSNGIKIVVTCCFRDPSLRIVGTQPLAPFEQSRVCSSIQPHDIETRIRRIHSTHPGVYGYAIGMYLRTTRRRNQDGSRVEYYQRAETHWDPVKRRPTAHLIPNFGRADTRARAALLRLARRISRVCQAGLEVPAEVAPPGDAIALEWARPLGVVHVARARGEELGLGDVRRSCEPRGSRHAPPELALFTMAAKPTV
jgi:hypothetical protein